MPICPRCGKSFTSEQALTYHLHKKFKCNTLKCRFCAQIFPTKLKLQLHEYNCDCNDLLIKHNQIITIDGDQVTNVYSLCDTNPIKGTTIRDTSDYQCIGSNYFISLKK